jgi:hypothetical protein
MSQSEIMRMIKEKRDSKKPSAGKNEPASARMAWHASPEEIGAVLEDILPETDWRVVAREDATDVMAAIDASIANSIGVIVLVWAPNLGTTLPHWVVITGKSTDISANEKSGYYILDPTAPGRPNAAVRYEAVEHTLFEKPTDPGGDPGVPVTSPGAPQDDDSRRKRKYCVCQIWKDYNGRERTAERTWVPANRLEEMLDEGAVRGVGLRYAIVGPEGQSDRPGVPSTTAGIKQGKPENGQSRERSVEDILRCERLAQQAEEFFKVAEKRFMPVKVVGPLPPQDDPPKKK